ncbi:TolC family outer membrane protein [Salinispirillum marinum]|uniref:TolC family outer membrane protein n=2 Tax=Saccharospirillaceae TaxID=255527 RepID=A0ABV8BB57_9GAMM
MELKAWSIVVAMVLSVGAQAQSLDALYNSALRNDTDLSAALANARASETQVTQGLSRLLPRVTLDGEADARYSQQDGLFDGNTVLSGSGALQVTQSIYNQQAFAAYDAVQNLAAQSEARVDAVLASLKTRVTDAYFGVLRSQEQVALTERVMTTVERQLEQAQERYDVGLVAITDVLEAQAVLDQTRVDLLRAQNQEALARQQLAQLSGMSIGDLPLLSATFNAENISLGAMEEWINKSRQNPNLVAGRLGIRASQDELRATQADLVPQINGVARYGYNTSYDWDRVGQNGAPLDNYQDNTSFLIAITATVSVPLFDAGSRQSGLSRLSFQLESAQANYDGQERQIELAVRQYYQQVRADLSNLNALRQVVSSRASAAEATELGYEVGSRNVVEVLNAQRALLTAQTNLSIARYDFISNYFKLKEAAGDLTDADIAWLAGFMR